MLSSICCREGRPSSFYEDEDAPHRRKTPKIAFKKLKKWRKKKERLAGEGSMAGMAVPEELGTVEDHFTVKVW